MRNFAPPADQSDWFKIGSVVLNNGDDVGVVMPWEYPATWDNLTTEITALILDELEKGTCQTGQRYSSANAATSQAAWAVALPGQNAQPMPPDHQPWVKNGTLYDDEYFRPGLPATADRFCSWAAPSRDPDRRAEQTANQVDAGAT
jgi:hypothetical protein